MGRICATAAGRALVVGCGLGDDAEHVASLGFTTTAFDVSPTAIASARRRFPHSTVEYRTVDLLSPPPQWTAGFDLVVEVFTAQVLTGTARRTAMARLAELVARGGRLLAIAGARAAAAAPWIRLPSVFLPATAPGVPPWMAGLSMTVGSRAAAVIGAGPRPS